MAAQIEQLEKYEDAGRRIYRTFPAHIRDTFQQFLKGGGQPDDFPGLDKGPIRKTAPFKKIATFGVERITRIDRGMIPCAMCRTPEKFLSGSLIWVEERQSIALIGHCCADKENQRRAEAELAERLERTRAEDYLLACLPFTKLASAFLGEALEVALETEKSKSTFVRKFPASAQALREIVKRDSFLVHYERIEGEFQMLGPAAYGSSDAVRTRTKEYGMLAGGSILKAGFNPAKLLRAAKTRIDLLICEESTEAALELITSSYASNGDLVKAMRLLVEAGKDYRKAVRMISEAQRFFSEENIRKVDTWAADPDSTCRVTLTAKPYGGGLKISGKEGGAFDQLLVSAKAFNRLAEWPLAALAS